MKYPRLKYKGNDTYIVITFNRIMMRPQNLVEVTGKLKAINFLARARIGLL